MNRPHRISATMKVYADYNATAPLRPEARDAMLAALDLTGNPSSVHAAGRRARALVESARDRVAEAIGACRDDIAFCSGGTEAVQAPLLGALRADPGLRLHLSAIEHDAAAPLRLAPQSNANAPEQPPELPPELPVGADGVVDLAALRERVSAAASAGEHPLVSIMLVNNETGVIQPVAEAAEIVHAAGGLIHCDAVQALGRIPVSIIDLDVDYLSLSGHKVGGPQGVGAFYVKPGAPFRALQPGGGQEFGRRAGTENVAGVAAFAAATDASLRDLGAYQSLATARDRMEATLKACCPDVVVHGAGAGRVAGVSCFGLEGLPSETQVMAMDLAGFAISAGAACSSGKVKASRVLTAMGAGEAMAKSSIRTSFGWASDPAEFDALADAWIALVSRARPQTIVTP
ncbi:MAG: cysteine desulfurase family protein [Hyphomonadaceae bacterium]